MFPVRRIASVTFETPDLARLVDYYDQILGLTVSERTADSAYLSFANDHHSVVLRKGAHSRCLALSFQIDPEAGLDDFAAQVAAGGAAPKFVSDAEPSIGKIVSFDDPKGTQINVFAEQKFSSKGYGKSGVVPLKLGHVAFNATDVTELAEFYCKYLGFRLSDRIEDYFLFLRCGPDHHTVNFIETPRTKMHHVAFELRDWAHVMTACDFLGRRDYPLIWGPGRHVRGHNIFTYHRNPDGQIVELFTQLDLMLDEKLGFFEPRPWHADYPHRPQRWSRDIRATNLWGTMPPAGFMD